VGLISALWGALAAYGQNDLKRLVAYSSINHMGYVLVAVGVAAAAGPRSVTAHIAIAGAALQLISHGVLTGALFAVCGAIGERYGTRDLAQLRGRLRRGTKLGWWFAILALGSLGIPGLSGFAAEVQVLVATAQVSPVAAVFVAIAIVVTTGVFARAIVMLLFGPATPTERLGPFPAALRFALMALLVASAALGLAPRCLVDGFSTIRVNAAELVTQR